MSYIYRGSRPYDDPTHGVCAGKRGTITGYRRHRDRRERPCGKCLEAWRNYQRDYRDSRLSDPDARAHDRTMRKARTRAQAALARRYAAEYVALVQAEISRLTDADREAVTTP